MDESTGGLDVEDDDSLTERAYLAPSRFSCAGPRDAYEYHVRDWRSDVTDVQITSPEPCVIAIYFVMEGGRLPNATEREELAEYISGENLRPLCDKVVCVEPEEVPYNIAFTYWIAQLRESTNYGVEVTVLEYSGGRPGNIRVTDRARNGFKLVHDGSATTVKVQIRVTGGMTDPAPTE